MKIDMYTHVLPAKYKEALYRYGDKFLPEIKVQEKRVTLTDHEARCRILDEHEDMAQVISTTIPPLEEVFDPGRAAELARIANDEMAELVAKFPKRYIAAIANLPLNDIDAAMKETERAIRKLGLKGIQIYTSIQGKPLSSEEFMPLYEMMTRFDLPIWIHPLRRTTVPDYPTEDVSFHHISGIFGWPYETTVAMTRLVFAGIFEKFPTLKIITHHCGGMTPLFGERIVVLYNTALERLGGKVFPGLTKHPVEYYKMFYGDTALNGNTWGLMNGYHFFGEDRLVFASDMPYDVQNGAVVIRQTVQSIERMDIPESSKKKIYEGNARRLLHL